MTDLSTGTAVRGTSPAQQLNERFAGIYATYRDRVEAYIAPQTRGTDHHLVEDLASETFIRAWRALPQLQLDDDSRLFSWLATIARRAVTDHYRLYRNNREQVVDTGHWSFANRNLTPAASGAYEPVRTGFRTATIGGAK